MSFIYPMTIIQDRRDADSVVCSTYEGIEYIILFDSQELAGAYYISAGRNQAHVFGMIDTPAIFLKNLETWNKSEFTHVGINPTYKMRPRRLLEIPQVIQSLKGQAGAESS